MNNETTHRSVKQIEADLVKARKAFDHYANVHFEGNSNPDNYYLNPHHKQIDALADELAASKKVEVSNKLSGASLQIERDAFNAKGFKSPRDAQEWCLDRGYTFSDLMDAAKAAK